MARMTPQPAEDPNDGNAPDHGPQSDDELSTSDQPQPGRRRGPGRHRRRVFGWHPRRHRRHPGQEPT